MPHFPLSLALAVLTAAPQDVSPRQDYAILVNPENEVEDLTSLDLGRIFRAEIQEWPGAQAVRILLPKSGTAEKQVLLELVYRMSDLQLKRYWTRMVYEHKLVAAPAAVPSAAVGLRMLEGLTGGVTVLGQDASDGATAARTLRIDGQRPGDEPYPLRLRFVPVAGEPSQDGAKRPSEAAAPAPDGRRDEVLARLQRLEDQLAQGTGRFGGLPPINLMLFGHLEAEYERESSQGQGASNSVFSLEVLDLLATTALTERWSVLAETVFEGQDDNEFKLEVERLLLKYRFGDALSVELGRFLSSIGHWNTKYHHGEWLQTSIDRPEVLNFEDDGGLLPVHTVGLAFKGARHARLGSLDYALELSNGRAPTATETQIKEDANDQKAVNVSVGIRPAAVPGLRVGGGVYWDDIPRNTDPTEGVLHPSLDEVIYSGFAVYEDSGWEAMAELFRVEHEGGGNTEDSGGWYAQVGRSLGRWTPYVRVDKSHRDDQDLYWEEAEDTLASAFGLRYDAAEWAALTLQYENANIDAPPGDPNERTDTVVLQATFVF